MTSRSRFEAYSGFGYANKAKLVTTHKAFGAFDPKKINRDLGLPYHEGSIKFFKEAGLM